MLQQENKETKEINKAVVMAVHKERYEIRWQSRLIYAKLKSSVYFSKMPPQFPTVGDEVQIQPNDCGDSLIVDTLARRSSFLRQSMTQGEADQAIAANFDYVFLVLSLNEDFRISKLERYMALAWQSNATPVIILTKADLCENIKDYEQLVEKHAPFVDYVSISTVTGYGMEALDKYLQKDKVIVCLGASGVGKSSLVNALYGEDILKTNTIRASDDQGHHTTTHRQMIPLRNEAYLIDTPGMRKILASSSEGKQEIATSFSDIQDLLQNCRFSNCTHKTEPGCAVQQAIKEGNLERKRWEMYLSMLKEEAYANQRAKRNQSRIEKKMIKKQPRKKDEYLF